MLTVGCISRSFKATHGSLSSADMKARKRVTLKEIAKRAGVATGTVSMVLNHNPLVAATTREHVRRVIVELGYVYDRGAAQMRNKRTNIVGVSICNLINPYFAEIAVGIERSLEALGRALFLGNCGESIERQSRFLATLREYNVDGVLLMPAVGTPKKVVAQLREWRVPVVMVSRRVIGTETDFAGNDNRFGSMLATRHLIRLGHERIAFVGLNRRTSTGRDRAAGFSTALRQAGMEVAPELVVECDASREEGYHAIARLLERGKPPTAVVCFNDLLAFGVMLGLRRLRIEPGRDFSVIGFDDVNEAALWWPPLTTVAVDVDAIGRAAGRLVHDRIDNPERPIEHVVLEPKLVVRSSCGPVPVHTKRTSHPA
jgi:LacI family transcriptional regulator, galactose operon repressor